MLKKLNMIGGRIWNSLIGRFVLIEKMPPKKKQKKILSVDECTERILDLFKELNKNFLLFFENSLKIFEKNERKIVQEVSENLELFDEYYQLNLKNLQLITKNCLFLLGDEEKKIEQKIKKIWIGILEGDISENYVIDVVKDALNVHLFFDISLEHKYFSTCTKLQLEHFKICKQKKIDLFLILNNNITLLNNNDVIIEFENSIDPIKDVEIYLQFLKEKRNFNEIYKIIQNLKIYQSIDYFQYFYHDNSNELTKICFLELKNLLIEFFQIADEKCETDEIESEFQNWKSLGFPIDFEEELIEIPYLEELSNFFILGDEEEIEKFNNFMIEEGIEISMNYKEKLLENDLKIQSFEDEEKNFLFQIYIENQILEKKIEIFVDLFITLRALNPEEFEQNIKIIQDEMLNRMKKDEKEYIGKICGYLKNLIEIRDVLVLERSFIENLCPIFESIINSNLAEIGIFTT